MPYTSSSGSLTAKPLHVRAKDYTVSWITLIYLFWQTLLMPIIHPASFGDPSFKPSPKSARPFSGGAGGSGGNGGGGSGGGGGGGGGPSGSRRGGGGGGFMSMGDLNGSGTVDGCRATCG